MAFTTDDFEKVWASTSPLTPYEFSESNYKEGWNFVGATPPARQMWDFLQKRNDEKTQWLYNNKLSLSGGTMTGNISYDMVEGRIAVASTQNEEGRLRFLGGSGISNGAQLLLSGKSNSATAGQFQLGATDGTNSASLIGKPDGTLTWGGKTVIVGTEASESHTIDTINSGAQTSFNLAHTPRYYSVSMSGAGFANMLVTKGNGNTFYVINTGSQNRTNIIVTVNYIY